MSFGSPYLPRRVLACAISLSLAAGALPSFAHAQDATTPQLFINTNGTVDGSVLVDGSVYAVMSSGRSAGATANAEVTGNVSNTSEGQKVVYGAVSEGKNGGDGNLDIGGNLTVAPDDESNASQTVKAALDSGQQGNATLNIDGNVLAVGSKEVTGIELQSGGNTSSATTTVGGNVSATAKSAQGDSSGRSYAVHAQSEEQATTLAMIAGDVAARAYGPGTTVATGVNIYSAGKSSSVVEVKGSILSDASAGAYGGSLYADASTAQLVVGGDVVANAPKDSVGISLESKGGAVPKLVVAGTVRAGTAGIEFDGDKSASYDVTVWKIEVGDGGKLVRVGDKVDKTPESLASQIKYIITIEQPKEGGRLFALNGLKEALAQSNNYDVAYAGDKVYLNVALESGYYISAAYNGLGQKVRLMRDEGGYYVIVPDGGGIYLTAELGKAAPEPEAEQPVAEQPAREYAAATTTAPSSRILPATGDSQTATLPLMSLLAGITCMAVGLSRRMKDHNA